MNAEFEFLSINTKNGWKNGDVNDNNNIDVLDDGITLAKKSSYILEPKLIEYDDYSITDFAVNECGIIYVLDGEENTILEYDPLNKIIEQLDCIGGKGNLPGQLSDPTGIAINEDTIYIAEYNRIQAFAKINWQIRWIIDNPKSDDGTPINPSKIAVNNNGDLFVLDVFDNKKDIYYADLNIECTFKKVNLEQPLQNPVNIGINKNGDLYIYEKDLNQIFKFDYEKNLNLVRMSMSEEPFNLFYWKIKPEIIAIDPFGNIYAFQNAEINEISVLKLKEDQYSLQKSIETGYFIKEFDSGESQCKWHKLVLDAEIPDKTQINVYYHAYDEKININSKWEQILSFQASYFRNTNNLKFCDALIHKATGRFLKIKLELISTDEYSSPKIKSLKVFYPRDSYIRYLPAIYQEDQASKEFFERFLSLFETFYWDTENEIDNIAKYFDAEATPQEFLSWLGTWVATIFDESWSEGKKKQFLKQAIELYKMRGTREGIEEIIRIYTGNEPIIVESWQLYDTDDGGNYRLRCQDNEKEYFLLNLNEILEKPTQQYDISQFDGLKKLLIHEIDNSWSKEVRVFNDKDSIKIENPKAKIMPIITYNSQKTNATLKIDDYKTSELKINDDGNIYLKNSFERLFGEPTYFSFCLLLAPYLFSFDAKDVMNDSKTDLDVKKLKNQLQIKEIFISETSNISMVKDAETEKMSNMWVIRDKEVLWVLKEEQRINIYRSPKNIVDSQIKTVRRIIDLEKPAHTVGGVIVLQPWFYLDMHTYLGINTFLTKPEMRLGISSVISRDTVLSDTEGSGQIERRARIGIDTKLT